MAPFLPGPVVKYSVPTVIILLSYFLYRRKKIGVRSDTGGSKPIEESFRDSTESTEESETFEDPDLSIAAFPEKVKRSQSTPVSSPPKSFNRSLSGVETAPIDIVYPPELRSTKSTPVVIPDEDLDIEIEKIKSMRNQYTSPSTISSHLSKTPSPKVEKSIADFKSSPEVKQEDSDNKNCSVIKESFEHNVLNSSSDSNTSIKMAQKDITPVVTKPNTPKKIKSNKTEKKQEKPVKSPQKNKTPEKKMSVLKISSPEPKEEECGLQNTNQTSGEDLHDHPEVCRKSSRRDSANHSPSDVMMASPSLSCMSDNHSEGSSDSGKGSSDVATPPASRTPQIGMDPSVPVSYDFAIHQNLVGKLIGRQGCFVQNIKDKCNAHVYVRSHPTNNRLKLCSVEGTQKEIDKALKMIRDKFPLKKYAEVTLEQVQLTPLVPTVSLVPDYLYLKLIEGINNDTILSCMVAPNHLFMQQPTHPSFPSLNLLTNCMNSCYNSTDSPLLPSPIPENTVCAAYSIDSWYRAIVLSSDDETDTSYIKFLDYGGYAYVENDKLRQIRQDFILLPFQASECFLSNVKPLTSDGSWPEEAYNIVAEVTKGSIIYTQVADYSPEGVPLVLCFVVTGPQDVVFLNRRLVDEGYAEWVDFEETPSTTQQSEVDTIVA